MFDLPSIVTVTPPSWSIDPRRRLGRTLSAAAIVAACLWSAAPLRGECAERPNVLLIVADDLRCELGCLGADHVRSPQLDALASRGRLFRRAYCQQAVCNPSRASFLTGLRPDTIRVWDLRTHFREMRPDRLTLPQMFRRHGYRTRCIGKVFHNAEKMGDPPSWSQPAEKHAGPHWADTVTADRQGAKRKSDVPATERFDVQDQAYQDGQIARLAAQALRNADNQPFFLAVGFWRPHLPFVAPARDWRRYAVEQLPAPVSRKAPRDAPAIALHDSRELTGYAKVPDLPLDEALVRQLRHGYYASVSFLDRQVGIVLDALKQSGRENNTIVVFLSDHGFHLGEHGLWCKTSCYEWDARVPLIVAAPNMPQRGVPTDGIVELVDLYPTLAELAGFDAPEADGVSLVPQLQDPTAEVKQVAFTQHPRPAYSKRPAPVMGVSAVSADGRYTEWRERSSGKVVAREYYDHRQDPHELANVVEDKEQQAAVATLVQQLQQQFPAVRAP